MGTCSTDGVNNSADMLGKICYCTGKADLTVDTNGGFNTFTNILSLNLLPLEVHYNEDSMAKLLSLKDVSYLRGVSLVMDASKERAILVKFE